MDDITRFTPPRLICRSLSREQRLGRSSRSLVTKHRSLSWSQSSAKANENSGQCGVSSVSGRNSSSRSRTTNSLCGSNIARAGIANNDNAVFISAASAWEISTKYRIGKLPAQRILPLMSPGSRQVTVLTSCRSTSSRAASRQSARPASRSVRPNAGRAGAAGGPHARLERDGVRSIWSPPPVVTVAAARPTP
jgi:hypothetical protein